MSLKKILLFILLLVAGAVCVGVYMYNKGPVDVTGQKGIAISAGDLYRAFGADSAAALKKYTGKILAVSGKINSISANRQNQRIIMLQTDTPGGFINCTMETDQPVAVNSNTIIKGICSGIGQADEDLGIKADVYLTRCVFEK